MSFFPTKNRAPMIDKHWQTELFRLLAGTANNIGCQSHIVNGVADHVHMLMELSRTQTIAAAVGQIKTASSTWVNQSRKLQTRFGWQDGYAAFSVSSTSLDIVRRYIDNQEAHHKTQSFQDEYREWLRRYNVEWDERYVWD